MSEKPTFSLISEPWIQCSLGDGSDALLSLRDVFGGSTPVVGIRGDSPTQDYAVLRVLLAIYWRAHRHEMAVDAGETFEFGIWQEEAWYAAGSDTADDAVLSYLAEHEDRFDLLHPMHPFMQVADLHTTKDSRLPVTRIVPEAESAYFSMRAGDSLSGLSFAEAARWLIHTQAYDYSGIKSGAVGDPRVKGGKGYPIGTGWSGMTGGTTILGPTLRETLVLNTTAGALDGGDSDQPAWEREPDGPAVRKIPHPAGAADLATWQSRRIRLFVDGDRIEAVLVSNGDAIPAAGANVFGDPMTPYRYSPNQSTKAKTVFYPRPYETSRMMWRSLEPLIALDGDVPLGKGLLPSKRPLTLDALSELRSTDLGDYLTVLNLRLTSTSYGSNNSTPSSTVDARIDLPRALLTEEAGPTRQVVLDAARVSLGATKTLGFFGGRLLQAAGGTYEFQADPVDAVLASLEPEFRARLRGLTAAGLGAMELGWQRFIEDRIREHAQMMLRGAGPNALIGREIVQNDRPVLITAGTAYARLQQDLRKALPMLAEQTTPTPQPFATQEQTHDD